MPPTPDNLTGREPSLGGGDPHLSGDEPSLPGEFVVLKALLADDISSIPAWGGYSRIERMQAIRQRGKAALPALLELCRHADYHVRETAITVLGWIGDPEAIPTLVEVLKNETDHTRRYQTGRFAAVALRNIGIAAEDSLIPLLDHPEVIVRENAIKALGFIRSKKAVPRLAQMLIEASSIDTKNDIRNAAANALRRAGDTSVLPILEEALKTRGRTSDIHIFWAINELGGADAADIFVRLYANAWSPHHRGLCLIFLSRRRDIRAPELLRASLKSKDAWERHIAVIGFMRYGDPSIIPELRQLLHDRAYPVRSDVIEVIHHLETLQRL
jgi:HEAT repeat protein